MAYRPSISSMRCTPEARAAPGASRVGRRSSRIGGGYCDSPNLIPRHSVEQASRAGYLLVSCTIERSGASPDRL